MSSSWSAGGPGLICPSCSRSHFPFCGRDHHAIGHAGFPPYAQGRGPSPLPMPPLHPLQPMVGPLGQPFYRPPSPLRNTNVLGHLGPPLNVRHEGFFEEQQPGLRAFRGPMHHDNIRPGLGFPLPLPHDTYDFDRFRPSAGGHTGRPGINVANNWLAEEERERERQREREMWLLEQQRNDLILKPDRLGAVDRHPLDLIPTSFVRPGNALGEAHELWMRGDGQARLDEYHVYRGSHRVQSGHHEKGREYDVLPGVLRGGHQSSGPFEGSEAAEGGHRSSDPFEGFEPTQGGHQSVAHFEGFEPMQGGHQILARFEGFKSTQGGHQSSARFEGFEPTQGVPRGTTAPFERENEAVDFADRIARPMNKDSGIGMQWHGEYRDFHVGQLDFPQGARKRTMMDVGEDVQDPRVGGFFGTTMDGIDKRFLGKQSPHHPVSSECEQSMHSLNYNSGNRAGAFGMEQMKKDGITSNKRQRVVSREEELLMEHGLLDDFPDIKNDGPFTSETLSDDKTLSQDGRHHFGLLLTGRRNNDDVRHSQSASEAKTFIQKFQPAKDEDTYNGNALERGYLINPSQDTLHGNVFMGARDQKSDVPLHSLGSQRDLLQGRSVESGSFWDKKSNDRYSVLSNDRFGSHESRPAFHATRDSYHMPMQQSTEVPILTEGERVHQPDSSRAGRFEEQHLSGGSAIQKFSQLRPESMREWHQEESLRAIEELHMDFVHQQQQKMHKQTHFQPAQSQEETFRLDEGINVLSQAHQPHLQAISRSQIEVQRQVAKPSSQDQSSYNQVQQLQSTQLSDSGTNQDQNECNTRRGESMLNPYGDGMHQRNLQAQHQRSQPFQHLNSQSDMNSKKNNYLFAPVHNYEHFQHSPPHHMVQEHNLKMHEQQQQRPHQSEQRLHQSEQQELQLMPNQASQNFPLSQQDLLKLQQQRGLSQLPQQQFQRHLQSQEQHHLPSNQLTYEKQNPLEWDYQRQQEGNQEAGKLYQFEVNDSNHRQRNFKSNPSIQLPPQFPQQPEQYGHLHGHKQQTEVEQAEQKSQYIITARGPEISHPNMHGSYELRPDCGGVPPVMQISATMPQGQNLSQQPQAFTLCPPIPSLPPPPLPPSPPSSPSHAPPPPPPPPPASPPKSSASVNFSSGAAGTHSLPTSMRSFPDIKPSAHGYQYLPAPSHNGPGFTGVGSQGMHHMPYKQFGDPGQRFPPKLTQEDRPKVVDAIHIFKQPGRTNRPDRFVVILRGLPGSGKSYLAKVLRDVEVMNGGSAPRIHSMDDYFMTEVEKDDDNDNGSATSTLLRSKKRVTKKVMEYCYEPDMEEAYRASMLKAFKKTLEEGIFTFIIVDDRNLRVADFAQFWAVAKRSGYEVYLLEAPYKDPAGCAARNVHDFTADKVQEMAKCWEPAPPLYLQLDISALFHGDDLNAQNITEVEMDTDDTEQDVEYQGGLPRTESGKTDSPSEFSLQNGVVSHGDRWGLEKLNDREEAKDLTRSKWSDDHEDGNDTNAKDVENIDCNALSGLMQAYGKGDRRMRWADQAGSGFSIGRVPQNKCSLIIGPGAGYNEASNPLPDEEKNNIEHESFSGGQSNRNAKILEQLRAEQETFRAVFDRRRHRIAVMDEDDE